MKFRIYVEIHFKKCKLKFISSQSTLNNELEIMKAYSFFSLGNRRKVNSFHYEIREISKVLRKVTSFSRKENTRVSHLEKTEQHSQDAIREEDE